MATSLVWPVERSALPTVDTTDADAVRLLQAAVDTAVGVLWALTGRRYGAQRLLARPCPRVQDTVNDYGVGGHVGHFTPVLLSGQWLNVACGGGCQSDGPGAVRLPGPVLRVERVDVEGVAIDPSSWRVEGDRLLRVNGHAWPSQDLQRPYGEPGTWGVWYLRGVEAPVGAASMVASLAGELYNAVNNPAKCRLPKGWTSVQRQGVTVRRVDPAQLLAAGRTGLPDVDLWIKTLNPAGLATSARVASPDTLGGR